MKNKCVTNKDIKIKPTMILEDMDSVDDRVD